LVSLVVWIYDRECFFEFWAMVFVKDVREFVGYEIVDDFRWGHDYFPVVCNGVFGRASSPTRAVGSDTYFSWSDAFAGFCFELFCYDFCSFCEVRKGFEFVPFYEFGSSMDWGSCEFPE